MAPPPTTQSTQLNASANIGGRRVNRKKVKASQRLSEKHARKVAAAEKEQEAQIDFAKSLQQFHIYMAAGKYDEPLLRVIQGKADGNEAEEPSDELKAALEAQKAEFLSGKVPFKQQLKVKAFCEAQVPTKVLANDDPASAQDEQNEAQPSGMDGMD
jgi:hypothetical protein